MKIVFVSNYLNLHQLPLTQKLYERLGNNFVFIATEPIEQERIQLGFLDLNKRYSFVLSAYESNQAKKEALNLLKEADVAIMGSCGAKFLKTRLKTRKLTFKYSERFFKGDNTLWTRLKYFYIAMRYLKPLEKKDIYFLCASAYTAADLNKYTDMRGRHFRWAYFREIPNIDLSQCLQAKQDKTLLWVGRMVKWKHPEAAINLAKKLKALNYNFKLKMVGDGELKEDIQKQVLEEQLTDCVEVLGGLPPQEVKACMEKSQIFLATSDFQEGWGVAAEDA